MTRPRIVGADASVDRRCDSRGMLDVKDYPNLALLCWSRRQARIAREDAFRLYEANWRHVDVDTMPAHERELVHALTAEFADGLFNA